MLSCRKRGRLLTPSIHWVSCVRLPRPVFIFFAFCLRPPYRIFSDIPRTALQRERMALSPHSLASLTSERAASPLRGHELAGRASSCRAGGVFFFFLSFFGRVFKFPSLYQVDGTPTPLGLPATQSKENLNQFQIKQSIQWTLSLTDKLVTA